MKNPFFSNWIMISMIALVVFFVMKFVQILNPYSAYLYSLAWVSLLLAIGYASTPSGTIYGKAAFAGVAVMVGGIVGKVLNLTWGNEIIIGGLIIIFASYSWSWFGGMRRH